MYTFEQLLTLTKGMEFPLGWDENNNFRKEDLSELNHLLISGVTGSGKSSFLDSMLLNLIAHNSPEKLRLVLCDTKASEFSQYAGLEHLFVPLATSSWDISIALGSVVSEGEARLRLFAENKVKDISSFNDTVWENFEKELPHIVVVVDDLSTIANPPARSRKAYVIERVEQILSIGRSAGIHMVAVTQTPVKKRMRSISSLFFAKVVFCTPVLSELRFLTGSKNPTSPTKAGDALFCNGANYELTHTLCPKHTDYRNVLGGSLPEEPAELSSSLIDNAAEIIINSGQAVASILQQQLKISYEQAANLLSQLEEIGLIGPLNSSNQRTVLVSKEEWSEAMRQIENSEE